MGNDNNAIGELDLRYKWLEDILLMEQRVGNYKYKEKKKRIKLEEEKLRVRWKMKKKKKGKRI
jgi:hypothetical protein